jgi:Nucleotidyltransferase of unknown function (DUF6036)
MKRWRSVSEQTDEYGRRAADQELILRALVDHEVSFLVLGGIAVYVHGYARLTRDVDVLPDPSADNLRRLARALDALGASVISGPGEFAPIDLAHPESLAVGNYFLETNHGALDLVNGSRPDLKRYRALESRATEVTLAGRRILVISKDDLIEMKREAGRPQDLADIAALTEVERGSGLES